jgi:Arc/MetJ family transcription regulator
VWIRRCEMASNLALDDNLLREALEIGKFKSKKETVNVALKEFVLRRKQQKIKDLFGKMPFDDDYDYKKAR